jgi:hypothetical protein
MTVVDWRKPMVARAEEISGTSGVELDGRPRRALLWHMSEESYKRVMAMEACYACITAFPARPMALTLGIWQRSGFNHVRPKQVAERLIKEEKCPVCCAPINGEILAWHDAGPNPLNDRSDDEE